MPLKRRLDYQLRPWTLLSNTTFLPPHHRDCSLFCSVQYVLNVLKLGRTEESRKESKFQRFGGMKVVFDSHVHGRN